MQPNCCLDRALFPLTVPTQMPLLLSGLMRRRWIPRAGASGLGLRPWRGFGFACSLRCDHCKVATSHVLHLHSYRLSSRAAAAGWVRGGDGLCRAVSGRHDDSLCVLPRSVSQCDCGLWVEGDAMPDPLEQGRAGDGQGKEQGQGRGYHRGVSAGHQIFLSRRRAAASFGADLVYELRR